MKKLIVLSVVLIALLLGCSSEPEKTFQNPAEVIKALDKHSMTDCSELVFWRIGANGGIDCQYDDGNDSDGIEIYTFDGNAKDKCQDNSFCKALLEENLSDMESLGQPDRLNFYGNVMLYWVTDPDEDAILDDLKD